MLHHNSSCASRGTISTLLASFLLLTAVALVAEAAAAEPAPETTFAVSTDAAGDFADAGTGQALSISDDGRYVAFTSGSRNLSADAPPEPTQAYVKDLLTGEVELVSRAGGFAGEAADEPREEAKVGVERPLISGDGRYVVFDTPADNLVLGFAGDAFSRHVYRRDLLSGETALVDRVDGGAGAPSPAESRASGVSSDGRYVVFESEVEDLEDPLGDHPPGNETVYVRDLDAGTTVAVGRADDNGGPGPLADEGSFEGAISRDGRYALFTSSSTNLDPDADGLPQVYRRDTQSGRTLLVSRSSAGEPSDGETFEPAFVGAGGCRVAFVGFEAGNLAAAPAPWLGVYLRDLCATPPTTTLISLGEDGAALEEATFAGSSADGDRVLVMGAPPEPRHLYLRDLSTGATRLIDRADGSAGEPGDGEVAWAALSGDGCRAAFTSAAADLTPQAPPSGGSNLLQAYARQLDGCRPPQPPTPGPGDPGSGSGAGVTGNPSPVAASEARLKIRRLTHTRLRLWFSAAAVARVRIRRHLGGGWRLIRTLAVRASGPGVVAVALPQLPAGRYRLAIRLRWPGAHALVRFLTVGHSRQ